MWNALEASLAVIPTMLLSAGTILIPNLQMRMLSHGVKEPAQPNSTARTGILIQGARVLFCDAKYCLHDYSIFKNK